MRKPTTFLCKSHPDFHIPADVDVGEGFDGDAYVGRLKKCGVDAVAFFAKCHYGHSYYYTEVGNRHPRLRKDMLAEMVRGCNAHGVGLVAYLSVFFDTAAAREHPDWEHRMTSGAFSPGQGCGKYTPICVNSGYLEELFLPQLVEVLENYDVDEAFLDTMSWFKPCFCDHCREKFGHPIPTTEEDPKWLDYVHWYARCYDEFYARTAEVAHATKPDVDVAFNWEWGVRRPIDPPPHVTRVSADLIPTGSFAGKVVHYSAGTGYPHDYMTGRFLEGLGDWNSNSRESILNTATTTVANGASFYIIDRQIPDGRLEERSYAMMRDVFGYLQQRRHVLENTTHVPETAVLLSFAHLMGDKLQFFPDNDARTNRAAPYEGAVRLMLHRARHFTALSATNLSRRMDEYPLIILPEVEYLDDAMIAALEERVRNGGRLLVTLSDQPSGLSSGLLNLCGAACEGVSDLHYMYVAREDGEPTAVRARAIKLKPVAGASQLVDAVEPMHVGKGGAEFGHGYAPPAEPNGYAAVIERRLGKGCVITVALPAFQSYWFHQNPYLGDLLLSLMDRMLPRPLAKVETRAQVELTVVQRGDDRIVHLVNHSGRERLLGNFFPLTEYMPVLRDVPVRLRLDGEPAMIRLEPAGTVLDTVNEDGYARVVVPELEFMQSLVVEGQGVAAAAVHGEQS